MKVLVTGATGFLGKHLVPRLNFCESVRCLVRKTSNLDPIKAKNVKFCYGDVSNKESIDSAIQGADAVIHIAAVVFAKDKEEQYNVNVIGTQNVVDLCKKYGIKLIYLSSVAVLYGKEHSNYGYSRTKKLAEEIVLKAEIKSIILRPSLIYGKGSRLTKIIKMVKFFPIIFLPSHMLTKKLQQPVYIKDVTNTIILALKEDKLKYNKIYYITGPNTHTISEIINMTTIYPFKPLKIPISSFIIRILIKIYQMVVPGAPINKEHLSKQLEVYHFDNKESIRDFGYSPLDIPDAIKIQEEEL